MTAAKIEGSRRSVMTRREFSGNVAAQATRNGFDLNRPLNTLEGDDVRVLGIDEGHLFPIVGEVQDYNSGVSWLARWSEKGEYRGTFAASEKHSFERNTPLYHGLSRGTVGNVGIGVRSLGSLFDRFMRREPMVQPAIVKEALRPQLAADKSEAAQEREFDSEFDVCVARANPGLLFFFRQAREAMAYTPHEIVATVCAKATIFHRDGRLSFARTEDAGELPYEALNQFVEMLCDDPDLKITVDNVTAHEEVNAELARGVKFGQHDPKPGRSA
jgi:hypothetical protein